MRSPPKPRMIGRLAPGAYCVCWTPGSCASVSPIVGAIFSASSRSSSTATDCAMSATLCGDTPAETTTSS